jgi:RES domain-containing protein
VTAQTLDRVMRAYRIGDPDGGYPIYDARGSTISPGRWNTTRSPMIYAAEHYSTGMLEKLVHGSGFMPPNQHFIEITISNGVGFEDLTPAHLPGWDDPSCAASRAFGERWQHEKRSLLLFVPSVVARMEMNILINPDHPAFRRVTASRHQKIWWDMRLFVSAV